MVETSLPVLTFPDRLLLLIGFILEYLSLCLRMQKMRASLWCVNLFLTSGQIVMAVHHLIRGLFRFLLTMPFLVPAFNRRFVSFGLSCLIGVRLSTTVGRIGWIVTYNLFTRSVGHAHQSGIGSPSFNHGTMLLFARKQSMFTPMVRLVVRTPSILRLRPGLSMFGRLQLPNRHTPLG